MLVAEVIVGGLARALGPADARLVVARARPAMARYEADEEVQDLLTASVGLNLGVDFLPGSFGFDDSVGRRRRGPAAILWLDAFRANVDRSWRNPNLLVWHGDAVADRPRCRRCTSTTPGPAASPTRRGSPPSPGTPATTCWSATLPGWPPPTQRDRRAADREVFEEILADVPDEWLEPVPGAETPPSCATAYVDFLTARLDDRGLAAGGAR